MAKPADGAVMRAKIQGMTFTWSIEPRMDDEVAWRLGGCRYDTNAAAETSELAEGLTGLLVEGLLTLDDLPAACRALGWLKLDSTRFNRKFQQWGSLAVLMARRDKWYHLFSMLSEYDRSALDDLSVEQVHALITCGANHPHLSRSPVAGDPGFVPGCVLIWLTMHAARQMRSSRALADAITELPDWLIFRACRREPELAIQDWLEWDMDAADVPTCLRNTYGTSAHWRRRAEPRRGNRRIEAWERGKDASAVNFDDRTAAASDMFDALLADISSCRRSVRPRDERR